MHPILFHFGPITIPTYGFFSVLALLAGVLVVRHYARVEGRDPSQTVDAIVLTAAVGFVGARVLEVAINWRNYFESPQPVRLLLVSTGVFVGGLVSALAFGAWWFRRIAMPAFLGLDFVALVAATIDGVGRWGCFFSGCCWGTPSELPWAVTFPEIARRLHAGLPAVPLHPAQIYMSLNAFAILGLLALAYRRKRFHGQIIAVYLVLYSISRFLLEYVRGDEERGFVLGGVLSTSQFASLLLAAGGIATYLILDRCHERSGGPDWRPAAGIKKGAKRGR